MKRNTTNHRQSFCIFFLLFILSFHAHAARVDSLLVFSNKMQKQIPVRVIVPDSNSGFSLYLLHGYGGNENSYLKYFPQIQEWADTNHCLIICPSAEKSWYLDYPSDSLFYESFISKQLTSVIDSLYPTMADSNHRIIGGISMGGHGALRLALRNSDVFQHAISISGVLRLSDSKLALHLRKRFTNGNPKGLHALSVLSQKQNSKLLSTIIISVGQQEYLYNSNLLYSQYLRQQNLAHYFFSVPGKHNWQCFSKSLNIIFPQISQLILNSVAPEDVE